jgi:hypothetical protein
MPSRLQTLKWLGDSVPSANSKVNELLSAEGTLEDAAAGNELNAASVPDEFSQTASAVSTVSAASASDADDEALGAVGGCGSAVAPHASLHDALQQLAPGQVSMH